MSASPEFKRAAGGVRGPMGPEDWFKLGSESVTQQYLREQIAKDMKPLYDWAAQGKRHDHRQSIWIIGGMWLWCYRCGALRENIKESKWIRPTGPTGTNPALTDK